MESLIERLHEMPFDSPDWDPTFERLAESVEHHVKEEEGEWFPRAQELLGEDACLELEQSYMATKRDVMNRL